MVFAFFAFLFFILIAGMAIGALLAIKIWYTFPLVIFFVGVACFISLWFGVLIGAAFFAWLPIFFMKMIIIFYCLFFIYYFFRQFHPSYGYIPTYGWSHWGFIIFFFFLVGLDFSVIGFSGWLLFLTLPIFAAAIFLGIFLIWKWRMSPVLGGMVAYFPLILFLLLALLKLL